MLARPGEAQCGDRHVVKPFPDGVLVAVIDGLGHGDEAADAAKIAVTVLETYSNESVLSLLRRCDMELKNTRGAVVSVASFSAPVSMMTWLGVGNIEGRLLRADPRAHPRQESLVLRRGVVGGRLPTLSASAVLVTPGDTLSFATDGVRSDFAERLIVSESPQQTADRILARYGKRTDDALVLVARFGRRRIEDRGA